MSRRCNKASTGSTRQLDELYARVSFAIHRAEAAEATGDAELVATLNGDVSVLEEAIARKLAPSENEGAIARRGAVTAALRAGQSARAESLVRVYAVEDGMTDALRAELEALLTE